MKIYYKGGYVDVDGKCDRACPSNLGGTCISEDVYEYECKKKYKEELQKQSETKSETIYETIIQLETIHPNEGDIIIIRFSMDKHTPEDVAFIYNMVNDCFPQNQVVIFPSEMDIESMSKEEFNQFANNTINTDSDSELIHCKDCELWHCCGCPLDVFVEKPKADFYCGCARKKKQNE